MRHHKKIGDFVQVGEPLLTIHSDDRDNQHIKSKLLKHIIITEEKVEKSPLIYETIK